VLQALLEREGSIHFFPLETIIDPSPRGEWRVESGEWRMEDGEWRMESGEWGVGSGEWRMESGEWGLRWVWCGFVFHWRVSSYRIE
jgi:hypothetical protein